MKKVTKSILEILLGILMLITAMPLSASAANYSTNWKQYSTPTVTLKRGAKGNNVKWLQCAINDLITNGDKNGKKLNATKLDVDGSFGPGVETAVKKFQSSYSLSADGSFGPASRSKMVSVLKDPKGTTCNHKWAYHYTSSYATCTKDGLKYEKCSLCKNVRAVTIPKTGHTEKKESRYGFTTKTCTKCGTETYNERKDFVNKLMKEYYWSSWKANCLADDIEYYNVKNCTADIKSKVGKVGKAYSIAGSALGKSYLKNLSKDCKKVCDVCDYIDLATDLKVMMSGSVNNYTRLSATISGLNSLCSKVQAGNYYTSALDTISKGLDKTLKEVHTAFVKKNMVNWAVSDIEVTGSSKPLQRMTVKEIEKNRSNVNAALIKRYKSLYGKTYEASRKNVSDAQYCELFVQLKKRQEIDGTVNFADFVQKEMGLM